MEKCPSLHPRHTFMAPWTKRCCSASFKLQHATRNLNGLNEFKIGNSLLHITNLTLDNSHFIHLTVSVFEKPEVCGHRCQNTLRFWFCSLVLQPAVTDIYGHLGPVHSSFHQRTDKSSHIRLMWKAC